VIQCVFHEINIESLWGILTHFFFGNFRIVNSFGNSNNLEGEVFLAAHRVIGTVIFQRFNTRCVEPVQVAAAAM
jgi:hypothetical protein